METNHDQVFLEILRQEKNITNFLDAVFGFLSRCTDFYVKAGPQEKVGFPPGVIEKLVLTTLCKWKEKHSFRKSEDDSVNLSTISPVLHIPPPAEEIEIGSDESPQKDHTPIQQPSDSYNGAIHLEKCEERWWQALIIGEPNIELNKINCSRNLDELCCRDQMKVQELMWNHQQKLLGKPTSEQTKMEEIFKKAWNAEGSPFKGTEYDPSIVNFN
ncbi:nudC domain-containing protein 3 isoform X3 [Cephus cinctus]|uniref:NudC domain-containing protein 3 isoform X3 n=1 Tax=Cephus cinctus TaxID=211228 RepID=A0AAJ7BZI3_CEPCN|nr:nudC domain-containing protein 3 isoform X3 [Cephus cinctus]